jgi:RimJ/RimL family protein N-acetyltransferase
MGYATEAAQLFRNYAFGNKICQSLVSIVDIRNKAFPRVTQKNGMQRSQHTKYYDLDVYIYKISKENSSFKE